MSFLTTTIRRIAGCLDAGEPVKVDEGCHHVNEFPDAEAIRCRNL